MKKLVLIDGNSLINRAFYAMPALTTKSGVFTNAVYGFLTMLFKTFSEVKPDYIAVAFDLKAPTFRHKMYDGYKATRRPMPDELRSQMPIIKDLLTLMNIRIVEKEGFEADDIIGTLAKNSGTHTVIITGDRDSFQLVDENTEVFFTRRGISDVDDMTLTNFREMTGIDPDQVVELKSLMGDSSDNIPGVPGIGEKTAKTLLEQYGDLDGVYAHISEITGKTQEKLIAGKDLAYLSHTLATIKTDCDIDADLNTMVAPKTFSQAVKSKFIELELKSFYTRAELFDKDGDPTENHAVDSDSEYKINVITPETSAIPKEILTANVISVCASRSLFAVSDGKTEFLYKLKQTLLDDGFSVSEILGAFSEIFTGNKTLVVFDKKELKHYLYNTVGLSLTAYADDVSIMKYLTDYSGSAETLGEVLTAYKKDENAPASSLFSVYLTLKDKLEKEEVTALYKDVELPLSDVLYDMESAGFKVDIAALTETGKTYETAAAELEKDIRALAGEETLNVNSPKQLGEILFDKLKIGKGKKTKTGYSTNAEILENLESAHPIVPLILKYRKIQKLNSTYVEGFKPLIDKATGLIKTSFNQTVTSTGRLSSKEPNLQNIPVRDEEGRELRKFFVPKSDDRILISADYSQIELRLLAHFSGCKPLITAFREEKDIHAATAAKVFGVPIEKVTREMRSQAKAVNFGIIYGISEYGLAKNLKISPFRAKDYIVSYFNEYPEVKKYMNDNVAFARETGYAKTLLGRRRYIREISSSNYALRQFGERAAMNMPLQGSSADIIKLAMLNVVKRLKAEGLRSELILQIHDELILDAFISEKDRAERILKEEMENAVKLSVPLTVSVGEGKTWFDAK
ncbi:MAG: DNA polymerase I [Clostridia bacterium]|nr:DNA polymerase I [Clostridia bacterium]